MYFHTNGFAGKLERGKSELANDLLNPGPLVTNPSIGREKDIWA